MNVRGAFALCVTQLSALSNYTWTPQMQIAAATTLRHKLTSQAVRDPLFRQILDDAATDIGRHSTTAANEATVEGAFERILYGALRDVGIPFHPQKEMPVRTRRHTARGRMDSRIGGVVVEYKQASTLRTDKAKSSATAQLLDYVEALAERSNSEIVGYLTDGIQIMEMRATAGGISTIGAFGNVDGGSLSRMVASIVALEHSALTARNLIRDFCDTNGTGTIFDLARGLYRTLRDKPTPKTHMLRAEWEAMFRLAHDDKSQQQRIEDRREALGALFRIKMDSTEKEYRALFALDSAYAIVLKLIAYRVVSDVKFHQVLIEFKALIDANDDVLRSFIQALEDGHLFRQVGILNLLEGDFFSWYCDDKQWNAFSAKSIKAVLGVLSRYEDSRSIFESASAVDLFRSLYEATVPQKVRSSLGEFYTPFWLAQHVVNTAQVQVDGRTLDPCCGSGTFLIAAIARIRSDWAGTTPPAAADTILSRVHGVDLNPLAVLTARVHYFIHIADLLEGRSEPIVIPVFLGDASDVPQRVVKDGVNFIHYELKTLRSPIRIDIPASLAEDFTGFIILMNEYESLVKEGAFDEAERLLLDAGRRNHHEDIVRSSLKRLSDDIISLERREWNGIWARIIANFVGIAAFGRFSTIVGNPPWVDWKSLPSGYRERIKGLCFDRGLFSGAGRTGGINLNICALIAHVSATTWLDKGGRMALLMPRELANQASYEGWRRSVGGLNCRLAALDDWSKAGHPFDPVKEDFMTFLFDTRARSRRYLPVRAFEKKPGTGKAHGWLDLREAIANLSQRDRVASQVIPGQTTYVIADSRGELARMAKVAGECSYKGREGIEFYPQEVLLLKYDKPGPTPGTVWMRNLQVGRSKYKIPAQRILLETRYLFPLVKGPAIDFMALNDPGIYVIFPYESSDPYAPVTRSVLRTASPLLYKYLLQHKEVLESQTHFSDAIRAGSEFYGLARTGPYSFKDCYVAYRDNSKWRATVVEKRATAWGELKRFVFQNHAVSMCERHDGAVMNRDEAFFVAGIFNTAAVESFIYAASDNRSFKIRPPVFVPTYDKGNATHRRIVALSKALHRQPSKTDGRLAELEVEYLTLCPP